MTSSEYHPIREALENIKVSHPTQTKDSQKYTICEFTVNGFRNLIESTLKKATDSVEFARYSYLIIYLHADYLLDQADVNAPATDPLIQEAGAYLKLLEELDLRIPA